MERPRTQPLNTSRYGSMARSLIELNSGRQYLRLTVTTGSLFE